MKPYFYSFIQKIWYKQSLWRFLLWPFSIIFSAIVYLRKFLYQTGVKKITNFNCPVIVIGNLTVGGTGKTPLVIALAHFLHAKGYCPGIISRGYKGNVTSPQLVNKNSSPDRVGDEPILLARHTDCPVVVCPDRVAGADFLRKKTACKVILSDDGLQHLALGRTIEIAVIDSQLNFGNGFLLPAGPLREPKSRLATVDFCIIHGEDNVVKLNNFSQKQFTMQLLPDSCINLKNRNHISIPKALQGKKLHVVAGIGVPERFFRMLRKLELIFTPHEFPDHHSFKLHDFNFLKKDEWVIMTEKDAVKCESFADDRYWYIPVNAKLPEDFFTTLLACLESVQNLARL